MFKTFEKMKSEAKDVSNQMFPDLSWVWQKNIEVSGPCTTDDYKMVRTDVLQSQRVQQSIANIHKKSGLSITRIQNEAKRIFDEMNTQIKDTSSRAMAYALRKFWRSCYEGIYVNSDGLRTIRDTIAKGPVVLFPTHKSHVDYIILSYICYAHGIPLPRVVAGDNLSIAGLGPFLKSAGAIWIRRQFGSDELYRAVFTEYIRALVNRNTMLECFIEGGRSRVGKVLAPKTGFVRVLVDLIASGGVEDVQIIPISISYDRLVESGSFRREMLGAGKQSESLRGFLNAANQVLKLKFGSINIRIGSPYSLRRRMFNYINTSVYSRSSRVTLDNMRNTISSKIMKKICLRIGHEVLYKMNRLTPVTPTAAVATILLTEERSSKRGERMDVLAAKVSWLVEQIRRRQGLVAKIFDYEESMSAIVDNAISVIPSLVSTKDAFVMVGSHNDELELAMYRNQLLHWFASESIVAVAVIALLKTAAHDTSDNNAAATPQTLVETITENKESFHSEENTEFFDTLPDMHDHTELAHAQTTTNVDNREPLGIPKHRIFSAVQFLSQLLKTEFIYKPASTLLDNLDDALQSMIDSGILKENENAPDYILVMPPNPDVGKKMGVEVEQPILAMNEGGIAYLRFLAMLLWPFIDVYWCISRALEYNLLPNRIVSEKHLIKLASHRAEIDYFGGDVDFYEIVAEHTIGNAMQWFIKQSILSSQTIDLQGTNRLFGINQTAKVFQLTPEYRSKAALQEWTALINMYRKNSHPQSSMNYTTLFANQSSKL